MLELNKIYNMNCIEGMRQLDNDSIDLVVTDPPYGILKREHEWDNVDLDFLDKWVGECTRVMKDGASLYCFYSQSHIYEAQPILTKHLALRNICVWHYPNVCGGYAKLLQGKHCYRKTWQPVFFLSKGNPASRVRFKWKRYHSHNFDVFIEAVPQPTFKKDKKVHPTQKPFNLLKRIVLASSERDNVILDPFMGSGTTAVACKKLGRNFLGFELSPEYCTIANKRLEKTLVPRSLFD